MSMKDLTDLTFGWLYVIGQAKKRGRHIYWHVRCRCGVEKEVAGWALTSGRVVSCSCRKKDPETQSRRVLNAIPAATRKKTAQTAANTRWKR